MNMQYDKEADIYIKLSENNIVESEENNIILD